VQKSKGQVESDERPGQGHVQQQAFIIKVNREMAIARCDGERVGEPPTGASDHFPLEIGPKAEAADIAESLERFKPVIAAARVEGIAVRGYVSTVVGCPYEGAIAPEAVEKVARLLFEMGCYEISLGETIGVATPIRIQKMIRAVARSVPIDRLAAHYHDTYRMAIANIYASLQLGISVIDASVGGLGGCPYAPGAAGNVATEDVVYLLDGLGIEHGADWEKLRKVVPTILPDLVSHR